jgi:hypothetical protein
MESTGLRLRRRQVLTQRSRHRNQEVQLWHPERDLPGTTYRQPTPTGCRLH